LSGCRINANCANRSRSVDALAAFRYHIMMLWMRTLTRRSQNPPRP
jgi:hypothetical protein